MRVIQALLLAHGWPEGEVLSREISQQPQQVFAAPPPQVQTKEAVAVQQQPSPFVRPRRRGKIPKSQKTLRGPSEYEQWMIRQALAKAEPGKREIEREAIKQAEARLQSSRAEAHAARLARFRELDREALARFKSKNPTS